MKSFERHPRVFGLDKELGVAVYAIFVVKTEGYFRRKVDDHIAFMGRLVGLVLDVPAEGFEEGVEEVDPYLGFGVALLEVVVLVLVELFDQGLKILFEGLEIGHSSTPVISSSLIGG
jgi:hypothetical protein